MQVKKFEARSMKEALEMVKTQLGPDAIILSAKDTVKNYGLGGEKSIEITAAYSESTVQKKKFVESKMPLKDQEKFQKIAAKNQKDVMQKVMEAQISKLNSQVKVKTPYKLTEKKYIDIDNDSSLTETAEVKTFISSTQATTTPAPNSVSQVAQQVWNEAEVNSLKNEIETLKQIMSQFKTMPQTFVHSHPGAEFGIHFNMSEYYQNLINRGLLQEIASDIIMQAQKQMSIEQKKNKNSVEGWIAKYILDSTPITNEFNEQFHLFVGPSGTGKTSSLVKFASHLILNEHKRIAIITTDTLKVGAVEQMKIFSQILNVPFLSIKSEQDWGHILPHLEFIDHVLVDYTGLNLRSEHELYYLRRLLPPTIKNLRTHLVLSAMAKDADLLDCAKRYDQFGFQDVIFNSLDEASLHGNIYNFIRKFQTRLFAFGIGSKVPEDFEKATAERVVDLILQITKNQKQQDASI